MEKQTPITAYNFANVSQQVDQSLLMSDAEAKIWLYKKYSSQFSFGLDSIMRSGRYHLMGWSYDFKPLLKKYLYKQHGSWTEVYSPNKTLLRKATIGKIDKIIEI